MKTSLLFAGMLIGLVAVTNGCAAEATSEDELGGELLQSEDDLTATPGHYEVDSLIKDLSAGGFSGATVNKFVDAKVGVYSVFRPGGVFNQLARTEQIKSGLPSMAWDAAVGDLETVSFGKDYRRAIPEPYSCDDENFNEFHITVPDPKTGKNVKIVTGQKMIIHRWQPGGVQLMNPISKTLEEQVKYELIPNDAEAKKRIADAKALEKSISVKVVVPALNMNKKDAAGKPIPSNPGGSAGAPLDLYFGRVNGAWKLIAVDTAAYDCSA